MRTKLKVKCNICGEYFYTLPRDLVRGHGCPNCKLSFLEREIFLILKRNNINFIYQYKPKWLGLQSIDFYLPEYNIAIECQGKQHFGEGFTHCKRFNYEKIKEYDERKRLLCEENKINLIYFLDKKYNKYVITLNNLYYNNINDVITYIKK